MDRNKSERLRGGVQCRHRARPNDEAAERLRALQLFIRPANWGSLQQRQLPGRNFASHPKKCDYSLLSAAPAHHEVIPLDEHLFCKQCLLPLD